MSTVGDDAVVQPVADTAIRTLAGRERRLDDGRASLRIDATGIGVKLIAGEHVLPQLGVAEIGAVM